MKKFVRIALAVMLVAGPAALRAQDATQTAADKQAELEKLAKASQNPVADMISFPLQLNTSYGGGSTGATQNTLNIQPVLPFSLNKDWNLITRTIFPLVWQPSALDNAYYSGLGSTNFTAFLSPAKAAKLTWGAGPTINFPSTSPLLAPAGGSRKWSAGPGVVALIMPGHFVVGIVANQTWSFAGPSDAPYWSLFYSQVFINYNLAKGWYLTTAPVITANWTASSGNVWTVPLGGGAGRIVRVAGKLPVNINLSAYGYAVKPTGGPNWTLRMQMAVLLPKG
jgi:hypothetical protein